MRLVAVQKLPPAVSSCWAKWCAQVLLAALQSQVCPWSGQSKVMPQRRGWSGERKTKAKLEISWTYFRYFRVFYSSSTAQGGGGSFKNRKPIGEVGCCESGMAERSHWWTERCLISLTLSLSLTIYLPTYLFSMYLSIDLSISLSLSSNYPIYLSI